MLRHGGLRKLSPLPTRSELVQGQLSWQACQREAPSLLRRVQQALCTPSTFSRAAVLQGMLADAC